MQHNTVGRIQSQLSSNIIKQRDPLNVKARLHHNNPRLINPNTQRHLYKPSPTSIMSQKHALALPQTLSPDTLDVLSHLSLILSEVRTTLQTSTGIDPSSTSNQQGLSFKDVARASDAVKHKLQKAREQVAQLPDMKRGVEEQEGEIGMLEARIERQRALLERLREGGFGKDVEVGEKMETA